MGFGAMCQCNPLRKKETINSHHFASPKMDRKLLSFFFKVVMVPRKVVVINHIGDQKNSSLKSQGKNLAGTSG
jgi:hypothetical protein